MVIVVVMFMVRLLLLLLLLFVVIVVNGGLLITYLLIVTTITLWNTVGSLIDSVYEAFTRLEETRLAQHSLTYIKLA